MKDIKPKNGHTPKPWKANEGKGYFGLNITDNKNNTICDLFDSSETKEVCLANAAFIVKACNSHEELLDSLKKLVLFVEGLQAGDYKNYARVEGARQAISKAEGERE